MKVNIKLIDTNLPVPHYKTEGAACVDLCSRLDCNIEPHSIFYIPLNVIIKVPKGYFSLLAARSSTHKMGIMAANGIGIIDSDFSGEDDEIHFAAYNFTNNKVLIEKGTRVAQLTIIKKQAITFNVVGKMSETSRGGFGSTGNK